MSTLKTKIISLRKEGKTYEEIKKILKCAQSTISYYCISEGLGTGKILTEEKINEIKEYYLTHSLEETANHFNIGKSTVKKYASKAYLKITKEKKSSAEYVKERRRKIKEKAINYKGGCCQKCGYNKSVWALSFHHLDPNEKDFNISRKGHCTSWSKIKDELDKCILVCNNCHSEIHEEIFLKKVH